MEIIVRAEPPGGPIAPVTFRKLLVVNTEIVYNLLKLVQFASIHLYFYLYEICVCLRIWVGNKPTNFKFYCSAEQISEIP